MQKLISWRYCASVVILASTILISSPIRAADVCEVIQGSASAGDLLECIRKLATKVNSLQKKYDELEDEVDSVKETGIRGPGVEVLAVISVRNERVEYKSSGVSYNGSTGVVSFQNPRNLRVIPLLTDYGVFYNGKSYATSTHFLTIDGVSANQFRVWKTPLDTSGRNQAPTSFTAVAVGM